MTKATWLSDISFSYLEIISLNKKLGRLYLYYWFWVDFATKIRLFPNNRIRNAVILRGAHKYRWSQRCSRCGPGVSDASRAAWTAEYLDISCNAGGQHWFFPLFVHSFKSTGSSALSSPWRVLMWIACFSGATWQILPANGCVQDGAGVKSWKRTTP